MIQQPQLKLTHSKPPSQKLANKSTPKIPNSRNTSTAISHQSQVPFNSKTRLCRILKDVTNEQPVFSIKTSVMTRNSKNEKSQSYLKKSLLTPSCSNKENAVMYHSFIKASEKKREAYSTTKKDKMSLSRVQSKKILPDLEFRIKEKRQSLFVKAFQVKYYSLVEKSTESHGNDKALAQVLEKSKQILMSYQTEILRMKKQLQIQDKEIDELKQENINLRLNQCIDINV